MATPAPSGLTDAQLNDALKLARKADGVELKITVPALEFRTAIDQLGLDPLEAQIRQVFFFDTPNLDLNAAGLVVRARRIQGKVGDTVVKLRPVDPDNLSEEIRRSGSLVVEVDAMPGGYVCSAALKGRAEAAEVRAVALGQAPLAKLLSKEQRRFFTAHAPEGFKLADLAILGPIFVLKQSITPPEFGRRLVAELWTYPDGSRVMELSTKCTAGTAFQTSAELRGFLSSKGLSVLEKQETKTKAALAYFVKHLRAAADA